METISITRWIRDAITAEDDSLAPYRKRIMLTIGVVAIAVLAPFAINNAIQERYGVAGIVLLVQLVLAIDCHAIWTRRPAPIPFVYLFIPFVVGITSVIVVQGMPGVLWAYPIVIFCYFVFSRRAANYCSSVFVVYVSTLTGVFVGFDMGARLAGTLLFTLAMINIMLSVISLLHGELSSQAITDPLTGAYNRRFMKNHLESLVARMKRNTLEASLLAIDIDHFKRINDELGHDAGDRALKALVQAIKSRARLSDKLFRMGGEEFLIVAEDTHRGGAHALAEALRQHVSAAPILRERQLTVSIGVAQLLPGQSLDAWMKSADAALYAAKRDGRNRVELAPLNAEIIAQPAT